MPVEQVMYICKCKTSMTYSGKHCIEVKRFSITNTETSQKNKHIDTNKTILANRIVMI